MGIIIAHSETSISSADFHFARGLFCTIFLLPFFLKRLATRRTIDSSIFVRGILGTFGIMISFWMIQKVGAAPARTIHSTHPIFVFLFSILFLGEKISYRKIIAISLMIIGLCVPYAFSKFAIPSNILLIGLFGAFLSGLSMFMLKKSAKLESEPTILWALGTVQVFIQVSLGPSIKSIPLQVNYSSVFITGFVPCLLVGILVCMGQLCMTKSFKELPASTASSLNLLSIPLTYIIDKVYFGVQFTIPNILMSALIILGVFFLRTSPNQLNQDRLGNLSDFAKAS
jgi:drug/metabolite transporter (DMT)-like permease